MSITAWLAKRKIKSVFEHFDRLQAKVADGDVKQKTNVFTGGLDALTSKMKDITDVPGVTVEAIETEGFVGDLVKTADTKSDRAILFLHGGGYIWGTARHFHDTAMRLSKLTGAAVLLPTYSLAPQHKYPTQLNEATAAFDYLIGLGIAPSKITLLGDSAGGNLAFALAQRLVEDRSAADQPASMVLYSPWLDLTGEAPSVMGNAKKDIMLRPHGIRASGALFKGDLDFDDPRVSPLFGKMEGLPPTHIQASSDEILLDDSTRVADRLKAAGVEVDLMVWKGLWHDFQQSAAVVPESKKALAKTADFIVSHW